MKTFKASVTFGILTAVLIGSAIISVIWGYIDMLYQIEFAGASAPAWIAVFNALPFLPFILIFLVLHFLFKKKEGKGE